VNGLHYFVSIFWNPRLNGNVETVPWFGLNFHTLQGASYGFLVFFTGTLLSSSLAILFGVPVGVAIAILISQFLPRRIAPAVSFFVELLAGIPSVIFGFWGVFVLAPYLFRLENDFLVRYLYFIPGFQPPVYNPGFLNAGIILALMIVPIIASISRDAMIQTPQELKEGARALGLTDWEITRKIVVPYAKTGIAGSVVLGLSRALGETMAVALVAGGAINILPKSIYYPLQTMAGFMAVQLDSAFTDPSGMFVSALMELALVLSIITILVNIGARLIIKQGFFRESSSVVRV
jgi:phosphate transport system permease protein